MSDKDLNEQFKGKRLLTSKEAALYLSMDTRGIRKLAKQGLLHNVSLDRFDRYDIVELDQLIEEKKRIAMAS